MNTIKQYNIEPQNSRLCKNFLQIHNLTQWNSFDEQGRVCSLIVLEILLIFLIIYTLARQKKKRLRKVQLDSGLLNSYYANQNFISDSTNLTVRSHEIKNIIRIWWLLFIFFLLKNGNLSNYHNYNLNSVVSTIISNSFQG